MSTPPQVSIVTPVYNEAEHIGECIESVLAQTYGNWDYTIVDNCSTDGTLEIARRYAARNSRIRICENQHFLPVIANHNAAFRQISSRSKYCKVVLGDDWIFPECVERMVQIAEAHPSVGIVGAYALEGDRVVCTGLPYARRCISGRELCRRHLLEDLHVFGSANSLLFRADLIRMRDPFLNEANVHADTEACFELLKTSDFGFVHQVLTYTRVRPNSLTASGKEFQTNLPGMLQLLGAHGREYLTEQEFDGYLRRHLSVYYRYLGKSCLRRRNDAAFWAYHQQKLIEAGVGFIRGRIALGMLEELGASLLNPKQTFDKLCRRKAARPEADLKIKEQPIRLFDTRETH
jgi:glycosyltransferase involved in cell wall biosynthesis